LFGWILVGEFISEKELGCIIGGFMGVLILVNDSKFSAEDSDAALRHE